MSVLSETYRLVFRSEDSEWKAYIAMPKTMEGAVFIGSIRIAAVVAKPKLQTAFTELMQNVVSEFIKEQLKDRLDRIEWGDSE